MKFLIPSTLLLSTLALATAVPASDALAPRADAAPQLAPALDTRDPKKSKPKTGSSSNNGNDTSNAADMLSASRALELGALSLGVMEIVRLWV